MASNELDSLIAGIQDPNKSNAVGAGSANPKSEKGHYFVDQTTGQYYYQSNEGESMTIVSNNDENNTNTATNNVTNNISANDNQVWFLFWDPFDFLRENYLDYRAFFISNICSIFFQVVLNTGGDQYQTVTIVPSDGNTGEVSYVLIVQQPEDKNKNDGDEAIGVYDFENDNDFDEGEDDNLDDKTKIRKIKPSQQVKKRNLITLFFPQILWITWCCYILQLLNDL